MRVLKAAQRREWVKRSVRRVHLTPRRAGVAVLALALVAALLPSLQPASAATGVPLIGVASGQCLDVFNANPAANTPVEIWSCNGQSNQAWNFTAAGELRAFNGTQCLAPMNGTASVGVRAVIAPCNGSAGQKWSKRANTIVHTQSRMCLDVSRRLTAAGTPVIIYSCTGNTNQQWTGAATTGTDTVPPSVPGNPRVSGLTCNSVTFSWNAATDNVGVAFYDVYHDGQLMKSVSPSTLSTTLTVVGGVKWGLFVNARDAAGNVSQASTTVAIIPPQCTIDKVAPSTPTGLAGSVSGTTVSLHWNASTDNVGVIAYDVYRNGVKVGTSAGTSMIAPATTFTDGGLAANTTFAYFVVARDAQLNVSAHSNTVSLKTAAACANPVCAVKQITTDTDIPWGLVTLPDGTIMYNRRDAHNIVHLNPATGAKTNMGTVPNVQSTDGEGGLTGLAISAGYNSDHFLYIMHTSPTDNRIVRIRVDNGLLNTSTEKVLVSGILRNKFHDGGRLRFGPDGKLYASTGDAQNGANAQNKSGLNGKVLRMNPDGSVPSDNPFGNLVWSYGHRNPQGLAFDSSGRLWEQEFGNSVMDETNLITKGGNYGWPNCEGTTSQGGGGCGTAGYIAPKHTYPTSAGSCSGIAIVRNVLYVACERGTRLYREVISGSSLTGVTQYFNGTYGRLRTVEPAPDGGLWLTTTNLGDKDSIANNSNEKILHVALG